MNGELTLLGVCADFSKFNLREMPIFLLWVFKIVCWFFPIKRGRSLCIDCSYDNLFGDWLFSLNAFDSFVFITDLIGYILI